MKSETEFKDWLQSKGFPRLGGGLYSEVYSHPKNADIAVKVASRDSWPEYIVWATKNGFAGNYAPKVYSLKFFNGVHGGEFYVATMERLVDTLSGIHGGYRGCGSSCPFPRDGRALRYSEDAGMRDFYSALCAAGYDSDMHGGNVMVRKNGELVVTDPSARHSEARDMIRRGHIVPARYL